MCAVLEWQDFNNPYCSAIPWDPRALAAVGTWMLSTLSSVSVTFPGNFWSRFGKQSLIGTSPKVKCGFICPLFVSTSKRFVNVGVLFMKFEGRACLSVSWLSLPFWLSLSDILIYSHFTPLLSGREHAVMRERFLDHLMSP